jgi:hypothetical protein
MKKPQLTNKKGTMKKETNKKGTMKNKKNNYQLDNKVIYKLTEYNSSTGEEKIIYGHTKQFLEDEMPTVSEDQEITEINFKANDMKSLCIALNN